MKWTDAEIAAAIAMYVDSLPSDARPSMTGYDEFRRERAPDLPSLPSLEVRGGQKLFRAPPQRVYSWSDADVAAAVTQYLASLAPTARPSLAGYERFRREQAEYLPSLRSLEVRGGVALFHTPPLKMSSWTDADIAMAVTAYVDALPPDVQPSLAGYERFRAEHAPDLPCVSSLKTRGGVKLFYPTTAEP